MDKEGQNCSDDDDQESLPEKPSEDSPDEEEPPIEEKHIQASIEAYQGPLPHPDHLERYENIAPGYANRILAMVEKQQSHRIEKENMLMSVLKTLSFRGQILAAILSICSLAVGLSFAIIGHPNSGAGLVVLAISSILGALYVKHKSEEE